MSPYDVASIVQRKSRMTTTLGPILTDKVLLYVEDDVGVRESMVRWFKDRGAILHVATDVKAALNLLREPAVRWDAIVTDWNLFGRQALPIVDKAQREDIPVMVFSGDPEFARRYVSCPCVAKGDLTAFKDTLSMLLQKGQS